ncbi:restriction endonuclease subunit S [Lactobacillus amylovorus]|uniref:restriction endonuclease subunit S n=1 Tax=Lactobacillus amylovorus TaxID=1604 RepID=UPI00232C7C3C|nr:restriction endonuclease subunit S [Lactobacillus amylovorus]MDB6239909.1 restriction endonuclease subunit S [Lactobacillus amylovorus]
MSKKEQRKAPVLRFKGFTDDWEQRKLGTAIKIIKDKNKNQHSYRAFSISNIKGFIAQDEQFGKDNTYSKTDKSTNYIVKPGMFAYNPARINVGSIAYQNQTEPVLVSSLYEIFQTNSKIDDSFLMNWFKTSLFNRQIKRLEEGGVRQYFFIDKMKETEIKLPSISEQNQISKLLQLVNKNLDLQQRKLDILKQLKKTYLSEMYCIKKLQNPKLRFLGFSTNWKKYQIKQLGKVITGSTPSTKHSEYYNNKDGIPWVTPTDIHQNITYSSARKISKKGQKIARIVPQNTILVTCIASIGKNTILGQMGSFNQQINGLIPDFKKYDLYFLFTQTEFWSLKMKQLASAGTMQIVNKKEFENIETFIPNLNEQQKIGSLFLQLDNCVSDAQKKITSFKQIKNFLLQNMFI